MKKHHISFKHAWDGILIGFKTQPNFKVHLTLSVLAIILGLVLHLSPMEWIIILFVIAVGLAVELINTAIEFTVDLLTQEYQLLAKFAKDTSAAAMLIFAVFSVLIAVLIFVPKMV
jgi:diacylglycerol kinase